VTDATAIDETDPRDVPADWVPEKVRAAEEQLLAPGSGFALHEIEIDGQPILSFTPQTTNLRDLLARSAAFGDKEYLVETDGETERRMTFGEHERAVASLAKEMAERHGVAKGDRVAILGANSIDWIVSFWATISLGAMAVAFNGWWTAPEIEYAIGYAEPKLLIADRKRIERVSSIELGVPVVVMEDDLPAMIAAHPDAPLPDVPIEGDDPLVMLFTSGTTGRPKGAVHSHGNVGYLLTVLFWQGARGMLSGTGPLMNAGGPDLPPCAFMTSPLFHLSGLHTGAVMFMATGLRSVWWKGRFDAARVAPVIERERCTTWSITETVLHRFVHHPDVQAGKFDFSAVKTVGGGGSAIPPATLELARKVFPNAARTMGIGYGMTECIAVATSNPGPELLAFPTSAGRPLPSMTIEIRDPSDPLGAPLPEGTEGEVWIRTPMLMRGYWRMPEATAEAIFPGGWLRTGDLGWLRGGRLYLASRRKDLILRGGENIYPAEIEARLVEHDAVEEIAILGVDDPEFGQAVKAVVVRREGVPAASEEELREFCAAALAYYKVPTLWEFRDTPLPRNAMGKLLRDALVGDQSAQQRFVEE
jgi:acyl-CoA synthetase (AMP-forming)/AMP-acid ligase II